MIRKKNTLHMLLLGFLIPGIFSSCSDAGDTGIAPRFEDPLQGIPDEGPMNFENPAIGQRNRFIFFEATHSGLTGEVAFTYYPDTLVMAITDKGSEGWILTEFLTKGSISRLNPENSSWGSISDTVFVSNLIVAHDSIEFSRPGNTWVSFSIFKVQRFPLELVSDDVPENPEGLPHFDLLATAPWMEYVVNYERLGRTFDRLNMYFDYSDMETDGPGITILYGPTDGLVRIAYVSPWTLDVASGWDLVP